MFSAIAGIAGKVLGSGVVSKVAGKVLGGVAGGAASSYGARKGSEYDRQLAADTLKDKWSYMEGKGLTNTEIAGSGAPGGTSSGGATQTLGNSMGQQALQATQLQNENEQRALDRQVQMRGQNTQLQSSQVAANAQTTSAGISASAMRFVGQLANEVQQGQLKLASRQFEQIALPKAAAELSISAEQLKKHVNDVATSTPEFIRQTNLLTMGVENAQANMVMTLAGVDFSDASSLKSMSLQERKNLLTVLMMINSNVASEAMAGAGLASSGTSGINALGRRIFGDPPVPNTSPVDNVLGRQ